MTVRAPSALIGDHEMVPEADLRRRASAAGVQPRYRDWRGRTAQVAAPTLRAILATLEESPGRAANLRPRAAGTRSGDVTVPRLTLPRHRAWGFTVQLYSVRSRGSWGHGDLRDLAELAAWSARELGAGFILINPLHAAEPIPPVSDSPYLPMTRRYISPLYLRVEDIPEYGGLPSADRERIDRLAAALRRPQGGLIDRDAVWTAKRAALELVHAVPLSPRRADALARYRGREGQPLTDWANWCALAERHGPDWRSWPPRLRDPAAARASGEVDARAAQFHAWLQWLADEQLRAAQDAALSAGMAHGIVTDLAIGSHPGGADAWGNQDLLVRGVTVGAPPDGFNQLGQDWGQPAWHPGVLATAGYAPLRDLYRAALRHAGGLRVDHILGLARLWWIPDGMPASRGAYVRYRHDAAFAALTGAAADAGALVVGEDLGTVERWLGPYLARHGVLGTTMLWFAAGRDGRPLPPARWRRACLATVATHDFPPVAGVCAGEQVSLRARLSLLQGPEEAERAAARQLVSRWRDALAREGLLGEEPDPDAARFTVALYRFLASTRSLLVGVSLADAVGERRAQNVPGTSTGYPNWCVPLGDGLGRPVLLDDLPSCALLRTVAGAVAQG